MKIINYPHPTLRHESKPLKKVDAELREIVQQMFRLMYEHQGVGLAANQVDLPYRLFIVNTESDPEAKDQEHIFINPVLSKPKGTVEAEEGCLSIPNVYGDVKRAEKITINAYTLAGEEIETEVEGLFARVCQHETDHLDGKLFIDRLSVTGKMDVENALLRMEQEFEESRQRNEIPDDATIAARLAELESQRT